ncbi:MAG: protein-L-isoaspartate(D-aspartate) O-methyltransferase [Sedimentisphaerales bacterium]|jgi:protein-L-isoaspartate(D-aspartate) O-methyltransferase|nr:protein-L-isoaspartate(D-aspartate) O-methyltransferase [Sedimentisphaerales bacterium]
MAAANRRKVGPREHLGLLFALVLLLSLWFVRHTARDPASLSVMDGPKASGPPGTSEPNEPQASQPDHSHPAFGERVVERQRMVDSQIRDREVKDPNVLRAMRIVPRHAFVPTRQQRYAYEDRPLPIEEGQTISQPYIVAFMTEALKLDPNSTVLEIGTGSGYQAAVCAEIARRVHTIEIVEPLAEIAAGRLKELGYPNVFVRAGDGYYGWPDKGPFDAIIGTAAADRIPPPLLAQLKPGGRMILPVTGEVGLQYLILIVKDAEGRLDQRKVMPVRFVPMTGQVQKPE